MRIIWRRSAHASLLRLADRAPAQALAVHNAILWLADIPTPNLGRSVGHGARRYWPVPPQGIYYVVKDDELIITAIRDARRRRQPW